jgi:hypothetical protein
VGVALASRTSATERLRWLTVVPLTVKLTTHNAYDQTNKHKTHIVQISIAIFDAL